MSQNTLNELSEIALSMNPGSLYEHYKGFRYKIISIARHSETLDEMVVYEALYGEGGTWVRPLNMFLEHILIDGVLQPRFKRIEN